MIAYPWAEAPGFGEAIEVAEGVLWVRLPLPMALDHVNIYALAEDDGWTLIDTGMNNRHCRKAMLAVLEGPLSGKPVRRVVMTHHHPDHIGQVGHFVADGAEVLATRTAYLMARMLTLDVQDRITPEAEQFQIRAGLDGARLEARRAERPYNFADIVAPIPLGYSRIKQGDVLRLAGRRWTVHIGNGHAAEHATLWSDDGIVLAGDQILPGISPNLGVYPTEPDADPVGEWIESCERFRALARGEELVLPGHKLLFRGILPRLDQLIVNHAHGLERLRAHLSTPKRATDCFMPLYKREIRDGEYGLALVEAVGHLNHLLGLGQVRRELGEDGAYWWQAV